MKTNRSSLPAWALPGWALLASLIALAPSCKIEGKPQPYTVAGPEAAALRAAFNAQSGKVRLIVLASPT